MTLSAFIIMPFHEPCEQVYREVVKPELMKFDIKPERADEYPRAVDIPEDIKQGIIRNDFSVVDISEDNPNVFYELGYAHAHHKELILISDKARSGNLPFDVRAYRTLFYEIDQLTLFRGRLSDWIVNLKCVQRKSQRIPSRVLARGTVLDDIVDASFYLAESPENRRSRIIYHIKRHELIPCEHLYATARGASNWIELCQAPLYDVHSKSVKFLSLHIGDILKSIGMDFVQSSPDYVSLGPGNGEKDAIILCGILQTMVDVETHEEIYYYPLDVSISMLSRAIKRVTREKLVNQSIYVKAMHSEFSNLEIFKPVYAYRTAPNLFSLLGNTIGNLQYEVDFLRKIYRAMFEEDILLLEFRHKTDHKFELGVDPNRRKQFVFGPLDFIGVKYEEEKLSFRSERDYFSEIDNTIAWLSEYRD